MRSLKTLLLNGLFIGLAGLQAAASTLIASHGCASTNGPPALFTLPFNLTNNLIQVTPAIRWGLFRVSDTVTISTSNNAPIRLVSLCGDELYSGAPGQFQFAPGHYFVETSGDRTQFAVLPDDYQGSTFIGTEAGNGASGGATERITQIQPAWARTLGVDWSDIEPQRDVWNWGGLDLFLQANQGKKIIYSAFIRPDWVGDSEFIARFSEYVGAVAARYSNQLYAIEIWNEPGAGKSFPIKLPVSGWTNVVQFYAQMLQASEQAIHAASSSIKVIGPSWYGTGFTSETAALTQLGANQWLDALSFHDYAMKVIAPDSSALASLDTEHRISGIDTQYTEMTAALPGKPVLVDEMGLYGHSSLGINWAPDTNPGLYLSDLSWETGMRRTIKYVVMYRAAGADLLIPHVLAGAVGYPAANLEVYGWDLGPSDGTSRGPHPKTSAFLMTCYLLNSGTFLGRQTSVSNEMVYAWGYPDGSSLVFAWCREGYSTTFSPDPTWQVTDIFGQLINDTVLADNPVLFHVPASVPSNAVLDVVATNFPPPQSDFPNLIVPDLVAPTSASTGDTIQVINSVQNIASDAGPFSVGIYLWSQNTGSILIGTRALDGLPSGATSLVTNSITLPQNLISGSYFFISVADFLNQLQKISGDDNMRWDATPIEITGFPTNTTLALVPISNQTVVAGETLTVTIAAASSSTNTLNYNVAPLLTGATMDPTNGVFTWIPSLSQIGAHGVSFGVTDGKYKQNKAVVITVRKPNTPPVLKPIKPKRVRASRRVSIRLAAKDRDRDVLMYSLGPLPINATFDSLRHKFAWTTTNAPPGTYSLTASVTDGEFTNTQPVSITVY